ncbi:MAG: ribonuclease HII [Rhizobiales bacterium]|nr:ribonuclease HII [Hyphomicrobiales bacterium]NRB13476.1 ribonuclease HII [Hyphomicrobiales bacterium]
MQSEPQINFSFEQALWQNGLKHIAGVDEAGRGPWAGPVVAGAVIFEPNFKAKFLTILNDSKKLNAKKRDYLFDEIINNCDYAIGSASVTEIDDINILQASMLAMHRAIIGLKASAQHALIDGNKIPAQLNINAQAIIKGDGRSFSIAAASIIAKVTRDRLMQKLHSEYPHYSWHTNAGYGTKAHQIGLAEFGITPHHRRTFKPIKRLLRKT